MPSNDGGFAFSSRVFPKASKIKPPYNSWNYQSINLIAVSRLVASALSVQVSL
jgi:hypothetical protein